MPWGCLRWACVGHRVWAGMSRAAQGFPWGVCAGLRAGGGGVAGGGPACDGSVWATGWREGREGQERRGGVCVWRVGARVHAWQHVRVVRGWFGEVEFAVHRGFG